MQFYTIFNKECNYQCKTCENVASECTNCVDNSHRSIIPNCLCD